MITRKTSTSSMSSIGKSPTRVRAEASPHSQETRQTPYAIVLPDGEAGAGCGGTMHGKQMPAVLYRKEVNRAACSFFPRRCATTWVGSGNQCRLRRLHKVRRLDKVAGRNEFVHHVTNWSRLRADDVWSNARSKVASLHRASTPLVDGARHSGRHRSNIQTRMSARASDSVRTRVLQRSSTATRGGNRQPLWQQDQNTEVRQRKGVPVSQTQARDKLLSCGGGGGTDRRSLHSCRAPPMPIRSGGLNRPRVQRSHPRKQPTRDAHEAGGGTKWMRGMCAT